MKRDRSQELFKIAQQSIPGGVNSPVRAFKSVGGDPLFFREAAGAMVMDVDGNAFIDYVASWGPLILGHTHPKIVEAVKIATEKGTSFGAPTEYEIELAEKVVEAVPSIETVRMVNSGTEAVMSAIRLARGTTGRNKIVKFEGCYHGHADSLLVKAGSGVMSLGIPDSPGVVPELAQYTLTLPYNNADKVAELFEKEGKDIACLIVEPIAGNMGVVPPADGFLQSLRDITRQHGALLIFDEVITGFRVSRGGAQERFGVTPDMTCLGKIIGGGLPVGAYGGRKDIMDGIAPTGSVYQAGTLSGNPLAMAVGIEMLNQMSVDGFYDDLERKSERLCAGYKKNADELGVPTCFTRVGSMFSMFFTDQQVVDYDSVTTCDTERFKKYFNAMLDEGVYIAPSQFEAGFMSQAHTEKQIDQTISANRKALEKALA